MINFKTYLIEAGDKNTHLEHVEDLILDSGAEGAHQALNTLTSLASKIAGNPHNATVVTTKWDGTLALFCGRDPATKKFFVGTKAVFSKDSKLNFTDSDVNKNYGDNPVVANILKTALRHMPKLGIANVLQGDVLFTAGGLKVEDIDGEPTYLFKPNTIVYGVPVNSNLGASIAGADIGIVFHTSYTGKSIQNMSASFNVDISKLARTKNVWFDDATHKDVTGAVYLSKSEFSSVVKQLESAKKNLARATPILSGFSGTSVTTHIKTFANQFIRSGKQLSEKDIDAVMGHLSSKYKSERGAEQALFYFKNHRAEVASVFKFQQDIVAVKNILLNKLNVIGQIGTFRETESGFQVTAPEGFVAIDSKSGKVVKLVDRLTFSQMNFARH